MAGSTLVAIPVMVFCDRAAGPDRLRLAAGAVKG